MTPILHRTLLAAALSLSLSVHAATADDEISTSANAKGRWGASDAKGAVVVPFRYDSVRQLDNGFFAVGRRPRKDRPLAIGVVDSKGKEIVPLKYAHVEYFRDFKRFKVMIKEPHFKQGYYDERGKPVVPAIYDELDRISNSGDEPVNIARRDGKYGLINLLSGKILIPVEYDALSIDSLMTDAQGQGIAVALKGDKYGVLGTDGKIVLPFEFDHIGDISLHRGAPAERNGKLVYLDFKDGAYAGTSDVAPQYSSNFVPRPMASINPAPFDGFYVAEDYPTMKSAWDAWKEGKLRWAAMPSIQINGQEAYVAFGQFAEPRLPFMRNVLNITPQQDGFILMTDVDDPETGKAVPKPFLSFTRQGESMLCDRCAALGIPERWRLLAAEKPAAFGGIGVAIRKTRYDVQGIVVLEVQMNGPAQTAGLQAGDIITAIDGTTAAHYTAEQARDVLRGPAGSEVRLAIVRNGQPLTVEIAVTRAVINLR